MHLARSFIVAIAVLALIACDSGQKSLDLVTKGKSLLAEGKYEAAATELKKATEQDKNAVEAWMQLGHAYHGMKKHDEALSAFTAAKRLDRNSITPHLAHAKVQVELGRVELATTELNFVVEMDPKNLEALLLLGQVSQMPHKLPDGSTGVSKASLERAELNLQAASALAPQNPQVQLELVNVYTKLGRRDDAQTALKKLHLLAATDAAAKKLAGEAEQAIKAVGG
jgi:Flp pilus assembly protein TadD